MLQQPTTDLEDPSSTEHSKKTRKNYSKPEIVILSTIKLTFSSQSNPGDDGGLGGCNS